MSGDWVNRIGIILNFCAGFLLAPELIGIQRLQRFEKFLEESIPRFRDFVARSRNFVENLRQRLVPVLELRFGIGRLVYNSLTSLGLWLLFFVASFGVFDLSVWVVAAVAVSLVALPLVASGVAIWVISSSRIRPKYSLAASEVITISFVILDFELAFFYMPLMILGTVCFGLVFVGLQLSSWVLSIVLARLTGNDRLRGIVVTLGIALFIVGNTLQLLATWL